MKYFKNKKVWIPIVSVLALLCIIGNFLPKQAPKETPVVKTYDQLSISEQKADLKKRLTNNFEVLQNVHSAAEKLMKAPESVEFEDDDTYVIDQLSTQQVIYTGTLTAMNPLGVRLASKYQVKFSYKGKDFALIDSRIIE